MADIYIYIYLYIYINIYIYIYIHIYMIYVCIYTCFGREGRGCASVVAAEIVGARGLEEGGLEGAQLVSLRLDRQHPAFVWGLGSMID